VVEDAEGVHLIVLTNEALGTARTLFCGKMRKKMYKKEIGFVNIQLQIFNIQLLRNC
jgi:hypothetical protein